MDYQDFQNFSLEFRNQILSGADLLRDEWTPGAVSFFLAAFAVAIVALLAFRDWQRRRALNWAIRNVSKAKDRASFAERFIDVDGSFERASNRNRQWPANVVVQSEYRRPICIAWGEYKETMVVPESSRGEVVRNNVRPSVFFNAEELEFETRWWRVWPGLFVSVGLLLTFLGLIAALTAIGGDEITDNSLRQLLNAASAKFIMSLTGLACSIVISVAGRISTNLVDKKIRSLCHVIEERLHFQSLEELAEEQLRALKEQGTAMRQVAMEMVAELSRPLKEDLPAAIGASIKAEVAPLMESLGQTSEQGLGQMVGSLSQQLSGDIGQAMALASTRLGEAVDRLTALTERMESGTGRIGQEYESLAARMGSQLVDMQNAMQGEVSRGQQAMSEGMERLMQQMNDSLGAIRQNTSSGAQAISDAAENLQTAAKDFRKELESASENGAAIVDARIQGAAQAAEASISMAAERVTGPLSGLAETLQTAAQATQTGVEELVRFAEAARDGGKAIAHGSERFEAASGAMVEAVDPIRTSIDGLRSTSRDMANDYKITMESTIKHSEAIARQTRDALESSIQILSDNHKGIAGAMEGLSVALAELRGHGKNLDTIDRKLGAAFDSYRTLVETTMAGATEQVNEILEILNPALATMQAVVEQAEEFAPQSVLQHHEGHR